ncbi:MAG: hypothetical protein NTV04_07070 [Deltaproteobacteria bacterium]|nr:hypothetical protein [Deltaproteobacteria bacterium]
MSKDDQVKPPQGLGFPFGGCLLLLFPLFFLFSPIGRNDEEIPGGHQEIDHVRRDGEDIREGKSRGTSASVPSEVEVAAKESMV